LESDLQADLFQGQLIRLCAPRPEDPEVLSHWSEDGVYRRHADTDPPRPVTAEHFRERDEMVDSDPDNFEFRIRTIDEDRLVGFVGIWRVEWANRHAWLAAGIGDAADRGRGYGGEAVSMALRYAFHELSLHRLSLDVISDNEPAIGLYRKLGFEQEGCQRERVLRDGTASDLLYMGLLARDWERRQRISPGPDSERG
jgi:hypothetical protein